MVIRIYWASVTGNRKVDGDQTRLRYIIESLKIPSEWIDITTDPLIREKMRDECKKPKAMPPQIFDEFRYLGDVDAMEEYVEQERVLEWFGMCDEINVRSETLSTEESIDHGVCILSIDNNISVADQKSITSSSPTSSVENERPPTFLPAENNEVSNKEPQRPARKNVLAAADAIENWSQHSQLNDEKDKAIFFNSTEEEADDSKQIDEERKRKILGLSASDNTQLTKASVLVTAKHCNSCCNRRNASKITLASNSTDINEDQESCETTIF